VNQPAIIENIKNTLISLHRHRQIIWSMKIHPAYLAYLAHTRIFLASARAQFQAQPNVDTLSHIINIKKDKN
jgi:hypothetical protein